MQQMYAGRPGFPPFPPNYHPGMGRPPYPFPGGERFRGPPPPQRHPMGPGGPQDERSDSVLKKATIIKDKDLKEFDNIISKDGGWAQADGEIDYNEKLVFSDDEDESAMDK